MGGHTRIGTFDYIGDDPATAPLLQQMRGSEFTFGLTMDSAIQEPVLIIKPRGAAEA